jgi:outer membrane protein
MAKLFTTFLILLSCAAATFSQRFVYVDSEYILNSIPEYKQAQQKLDDIAEGWRAEIDRRPQVQGR